MAAGWRMCLTMEGKGLINMKISMGIKLLLPKISEIAFAEYLYITDTLLKKKTLLLILKEMHHLIAVNLTCSASRIAFRQVICSCSLLLFSSRVSFSDSNLLTCSSRKLT